MTDLEEFVPIPGCSRYEVNRLGVVRSYAAAVVGKPVPHTLSPGLNGSGYPTVLLMTDERGRRSITVHRVVALTFIGPRPTPKTHIRHLDGNKLNNALSNLAYGTAKENSADIRLHGGHYNTRKTHCPYGHGFAYLSTQPTRYCKQCNARRSRERRARQRAAAAA